MRTGVKDENNLCMTDTELPGRLAQLAGVEVVDYDCLTKAEVLVKYKNSNLKYKGNMWSDIIEQAENTKVLATFDSEFYKGSPCITSNSYENGICYYVGTEPNAELMESFIKDTIDDAGISTTGNSDMDVEIDIREDDNNKWMFIINLTNSEKNYAKPEGYELIIGKSICRLEAFEYQVFQMKK